MNKQQTDERTKQFTYKLKRFLNEADEKVETLINDPENLLKELDKVEK